MQGGQLVLDGREAGIRFLSDDREYEEACTSVAALKNNFYAFRPFHITECMYKHNHSSEDEYPFGNCAHRVVASDSHLYCLLNFSREHPVSKALWSFNFATGRWKSMLHATEDSDNPVTPSTWSFDGLASYHNALVCYGGTTDMRRGIGSNTTRVLTTGANPIAMELQTTGDIPVATCVPAIVIHDDYLYVIGGRTGLSCSCDVFRLHLGTKVWSNEYTCRGEIDVEPQGRYYHELCCDGQLIFVLGGVAPGVLFGLEKVPAFHMCRKCWTSFDTLPDPAASAADPQHGFPVARKCFSCVQHTERGGDTEVYITGGRGGMFKFLADIWRLNLRTKQWTRLEVSLPNPTCFHAAAVTASGCMYIFGGYEEECRLILAKNRLSKMWLKIPALSEICWESMISHNTNPAEQLLDEGVPIRFVERQM